MNKRRLKKYKSKYYLIHAEGGLWYSEKLKKWDKLENDEFRSHGFTNSCKKRRMKSAFKECDKLPSGSSITEFTLIKGKRYVTNEWFKL